MEIRFAQCQDIPGILKLLLQVGQVHHQIRPDIFRSGAQKYTAAELEVILTDPKRPVFAAVEGPQLLGYAFCIHRDYDGTGASTCRKELYIDDVCVDEAFRGRGIATALLKQVYTYAQAQHCTFVTLNVWNGNESARRFYEHMGLTTRNTTMEIKL